MDQPESEERKRKAVVYHEGKAAAVRFASSMREILSVSKNQIVKAEKRAQRKHAK
ncbi:MAG: hypothetical protein ABR526_11550 [Chthoniobacterales bacterium]